MGARAKIDALVAKALHEGTPIEEARTSALLALQLARRTGTTLRFDPEPEPKKHAPPPPRRDDRPPPGPEPRPQPSYPGGPPTDSRPRGEWRTKTPAEEARGRVRRASGLFQASAPGSCAGCTRQYVPGEVVMSTPIGITHASCGPKHRPVL